MRSFIATVAVAAVMILSACGGDDDGGADAAPPDAPPPADAPIDVVMIDVAVCHTCSDILGGNGEPPLCAGSEALFTTLNACICSGACMAACGANVCMNMAPDTACTNCIQDPAAGCGNEFAACSAD